MTKTIIQIDEEKCVGCSLCAKTCKQSAIEMVNGKAKVVRDDYCDGIGNCLPVCPTNAISFSNIPIKKEKPSLSFGGCPSSVSKNITPEKNEVSSVDMPSALRQWPIQIKLISETTSYFNDADLLVAADCAAYAYANFHADFINGKIAIIGCPKLDEGDYTEKLTKILAYNDIKSVTVARMEVPCCFGIENATLNAVKASGKTIPCDIKTISIDGKLL